MCVKHTAAIMCDFSWQHFLPTPPCSLPAVSCSLQARHSIHMCSLLVVSSLPQAPCSPPSCLLLSPYTPKHSHVFYPGSTFIPSSHVFSPSCPSFSPSIPQHPRAILWCMMWVPCDPKPDLCWRCGAMRYSVVRCGVLRLRRSHRSGRSLPATSRSPGCACMLRRRLHPVQQLLMCSFSPRAPTCCRAAPTATS